MRYGIDVKGLGAIAVGTDVLAALSLLRRQQHPFLYLGYWIAKSRKMAYKSHFHSLQKLGPAGWVAVDRT